MPVRDAGGNLLQYVALFSDVTQLKEHERQLEHVANYDVLTSLPNRTLFADRLRQAMVLPSRGNRLLAVAYLDLDGFKSINDRHGHDAGDRLLTSLAFNMKCALRKGDTLARLGGDEFVAVMLDLDERRIQRAGAESLAGGRFRAGAGRRPIAERDGQCWRDLLSTGVRFGCGFAAAPGRPGHVPGQAGRRPSLPHLRSRTRPYCPRPA
jgi:GGDEF domain-containing protein